jgi:uncharacterized membrane protein
VSPLLLLKLIHILAGIVAVGANVSSVLWLRRAGRDRERLLFVIGSVRAIDRGVANPGYIVLLASGAAMVAGGFYSLGSGWILAALGLYAFTALLGLTLFAPAIRRQLAEAERDPASEAYAATARRSSTLGLLTTGIVIVIVALMVFKPS